MDTDELDYNNSMDERQQQLLSDIQDEIKDWFERNWISMIWFQDDQYATDDEYFDRQVLFKDIQLQSFQQQIKYFEHVGRSYSSGFHQLSHTDWELTLKPATIQERAFYNEWIISHWNTTLLKGNTRFNIHNYSEIYIDHTILIGNYRSHIKALDKAGVAQYQQKQMLYVNDFLALSRVSNDLIEKVYFCVKTDSIRDLYLTNYNALSELIGIARVWHISFYKVFLDSQMQGKKRQNLNLLNVHLKPMNDGQIKDLWDRLLKMGFIHKATQYKTFKAAIRQNAGNEVIKICWTLIDDNKEVNKVPLVALIDGILEDKVENANKYIVKYFTTSIDKPELTISTGALTYSRGLLNKRAKEKSPPTASVAKIIQILGKIFP